MLCDKSGWLLFNVTRVSDWLLFNVKSAIKWTSVLVHFGFWILSWYMLHCFFEVRRIWVMLHTYIYIYYYMAFFISYPLSWYQPESRQARGMIYERGLIKGMAWKMTCHDMFIIYFNKGNNCTKMFSHFWLELNTKL